MFSHKEIGSWLFRVSPHKVVMRKEEKDSLLVYLQKWRKLFPTSNNLAESVYGVPSIIVRFDYVVNDGVVRVFEIEERPAGLGVTPLLNETFLPLFKQGLTSIEDDLNKKVALYVSPLRDGSSDDEVFAKVAGIPIMRGDVSSYTLESYAWYVRSNRDEESINSKFTPYSISTTHYEGDKSYGVHLNLWKEIKKDELLDFSHAFVVKPKAGSRFEEVLLYHPDKKVGPGFATKTKISNALQEGRVTYIQDFYSAETPPFGDGTFKMMRRAYCMYSPDTDSFTMLGGIWIATPNARIHGTKDSVNGPLVL